MGFTVSKFTINQSQFPNDYRIGTHSNADVSSGGNQLRSMRNEVLDNAGFSLKTPECRMVDNFEIVSRIRQSYCSIKIVKRGSKKRRYVLDLQGGHLYYESTHRRTTIPIFQEGVTFEDLDFFLFSPRSNREDLPIDTHKYQKLLRNVMECVMTDKWKDFWLTGRRRIQLQPGIEI